MNTIISSLNPYINSLKKEIDLMVIEQKQSAHYILSDIKYTEKKKYYDIVKFNIVKNVKKFHISAFQGVMFKEDQNDRKTLFGTFLGFSGKEISIAVQKSEYLSEKYFKRPLLLFEADLLFLLYIQLDILTKIQYGEIKKVVQFLSGEKKPSINSNSHFWSKTFNDAQINAINNILNIDDNNFITLIHGPPGTGKTHVISDAIFQFIELGKSILLTSHTNIAVDNALEKIYGKLLNRNKNPKDYIFRIGNPISADNPKIQELYVDNLDDIGTYDGKVIGITLSKLSIIITQTNLDYNDPPFDYVFFDEASMANLALSLTTFIVAKRIIMLGDPQQLPPIVKDEDAPNEVKESLFEKIINTYPEISTFLNIQYRSHPSIAEFSSKLFYGSRLKSAEYTNSKQIKKEDSTTPLLSAKSNFVWLNSGKDGHIEWAKLGKKQSAYNLYEISLIGCLVNSFRDLGYNIGKDLKIITPFRLQANIIHQMIKDELSLECEVEDLNTFPSASTIDRIQGREVEILIISLVDCGKQWKVHRILNDYRRLNVALTRAKCKVIVIGSEFLAKHDTAPDFIKYLYSYAKNYYDLVEDINFCDKNTMQSLAEISLKRVIET